MFILLSDCFGDANALNTSLRLLRARGHEVMVLHILAPEEVEFNFRHWSAFQSLESDRRLHLDPATVREEYLKRMKAFIEGLQQATAAIGADYLRLHTNDELGDALAYFLRSRAARSRASGSSARRLVSV